MYNGYIVNIINNLLKIQARLVYNTIKSIHLLFTEWMDFRLLHILYIQVV